MAEINFVIGVLGSSSFLNLSILTLVEGLYSASKNFES